jgi:hypothetical protein
MGHPKLRIGCVLLLGGAFANCGGIVGCGVGTPAEPRDRPDPAGGSGSVGVPPNGGHAGDDGAPGSGASGSAGSAGLGGEAGVRQHGGEASVAGAGGDES